MNQAVIDETCVSIRRNIDNLERSVSKLKETFRDNDYHIRQISNHVGKIKCHIDAICDEATRSDGSPRAPGTMSAGDSKSNELSGDVIRERIKTIEQHTNFGDRKIRKTSSLKYLSKWENILEEQWNEQNKTNDEYDFSGVSIVVPKRVRQFDGKRSKKRASSSADRFHDQSLTKCSSIGCILESNQEDEDFDCSIRKFNSVDNILDVVDNKDHTLGNKFESDYLLSLKDLEMIGKATRETKENNSKNDDTTIKENNCETNFKPKIVGVIYKERL